MDTAKEQPAPGEDQAFLRPPRHIGSPLPEQASANRAFQGIPSLAVTPAGRLWAVWYAGVNPAEDENNYVVLAASEDGGETWREMLTVDPDGPGPVRAFDPEVWMGPDGTLRLFWAQAIGHDGTVSGTWMLETEEPEAEQPAWGSPVRIADGIMMCKPTILTTGEWVAPVSTWKKTDASARMAVSTDGGRTWTVRGGCTLPEPDRSFDEHQFVERKDGSLWLLARTSYGIGESVSPDRGAAWPVLTPSPIPHPSSRFFIDRLDSGRLLLVKHGSMREASGRSHLTAYLSDDDGQTWEGGLLLDERDGVSYPDGQQDAAGTIRVVYDFERTKAREILMAEFREEDVLAGRPVSAAARLRRIVARGGADCPARNPAG